MKLLVLALLPLSAWAVSYQLVGTQTLQTNYGASYLVCTYQGPQGAMFSLAMQPGQPCAPSVNR